LKVTSGTDYAADRPPLRYLLLDDHSSRVEQFKADVSGPGLKFRIATEAAELEGVKDQLVVLEGAVIDFHLNTPKKPGYTYLRYPCTARDCPNLVVGDHGSSDEVAKAREEHDWHRSAGIPTVDVTTGLGAMCYIKQHAPDVTLYGFCELSADHSLLFLLAAQMWLGAGAINAEYPPDQIRRALLSDEPEKHLPIQNQLQAAAQGFADLTNSLDFLKRGVEAWDWLGEFRFCPRKSTRAEFARRLNRRFGVNTLEFDVYRRLMRRWQYAIEDIFTAFGKDVSGWPDITRVTNSNHWDKCNPVLDFVQSGDWQTFFTQPDVRSALAYYRANEQRKTDEVDVY
jgi:hypothetical protein